MATLAVQRNVAVVDLAAVTGDRLDELNPDGAHWSWAIHADVADRMAAVLAPQLVARGE